MGRPALVAGIALLLLPPLLLLPLLPAALHAAGIWGFETAVLVALAIVAYYSQIQYG